MILYIINNIIHGDRYVINNRRNIMHILPSLQFYDSGGLGKCTETSKEDSLKNKKIKEDILSSGEIQDIVSSEEVVRLFQKYKTKNGQIIIIDKNLPKDCIW